MTSPIGYNNPAYSHQYDSTLYDYQYVPEIDPEFDQNQDHHEPERIHLVHSNFQEDFSGASEEFDASDESNQSIVVEECNNRRITLICEKRNKTDKLYDEDKAHGAYNHDISLESEKDYRALMQQEDRTATEMLTQRHARRLEPPTEVNSNMNRLVQAGGQHHQTSQRPQRHHRYEEIVTDDEFNGEQRVARVSRHRYAEITVDENGYPSIGNEIEIEQNENGYRIVTSDSETRSYSKKPRAASPVQSFSPTFSPSKTYQRTVSPHPPQQRPPPPTPSRNVIEMAELSPPRTGNRFPAFANQSHFQSPRRHSPIGAPTTAVLQEQRRMTSLKGGTSARQSNRQEGPSTRNATPSKSTCQQRPSVTQMFQAKTTPKTPRGQGPKLEERNSSRRNISYSFTDPPMNYGTNPSSPYKPTTAEMPKAKTAIITPILQRKNKVSGSEDDTMANFRKMSHLFQSTGNLVKNGECLPEQKTTSDAGSKARMKRNRSVPNFAQSMANEEKYRYRSEYSSPPGVHKSVRKLEYQYSPAKSVDRFSPINRSRISLIEQTKMSWSNSVSEIRTPVSSCLILGAVIQVVTSVASCAICFYLFSKLGRRYYLDFGILAGFVNFVLGVLGFRSHCWKWLPNRNYVSGYILLTAFSIITCSGFVYLITARPMSGDPILDLMGGGICGVSVLTIILSVTGLTMSGCCKTPPPDNRVNNI